MSRPKKPRAIDLFCGCGGMTLGLRQAGFKVVGAIDIEPAAVKTYKANHRDVHVWQSDISDLSGQEILDTVGMKRGEIDLLGGCPPCQGFSTLTTLNGSRSGNDIRNDLVNEFARLTGELFPRAIMMENVPGLASDYRFKQLLDVVKKWGYQTTWEVRNAADHGVPQRRRRLILMASRVGKISLPDPLPNRRTVFDAIGCLPKAGASGDTIHDLAERRTKKIQERIAAIPHDGGSRRDLPKRLRLKCHEECNGFKDVYGRMAWQKVSPTITSGCFNPSKGRFLHPEENRAITMREASLLQSFPMDYKFPVSSSKTALALMIGNALPPEFIRQHAIALTNRSN